MKPGGASRTAVLVCVGRAIAHGTTPVARFSDPTAMALLPDDARAMVERIRAGVQPRDLGERWQRGSIQARAQLMVARTVAIDDAVREVTAPQVVILGAGLDGRAWRMTELASARVFEVDHPDSQRDKRTRVSGLTRTARDVRFVCVDFTRDDLDSALAGAGHDPAQSTTWIWEGVVMYLTREQIEATLAVVARRSAPNSRLIIAYHTPALMLLLIGLLVRRLGEPLRSAFTPMEARSLLARYGFEVIRDEDIPEIAARLSPDLARATRMMKHMRIVVADLKGGLPDG
jgi:methyltransferase (TIGR00027 family)